MFTYLFYTCLSTAVYSFYVPGVAPTDYEKNDEVEIKAVKMTSSKTQLPYEYYTLPLCKPEKVEYTGENLGEVLRGDRIVNTQYDVKMMNIVGCKLLCEEDVNQDQLKKFDKMIKEEYNVHFLADNAKNSQKIHLLFPTLISFFYKFRLASCFYKMGAR